MGPALVATGLLLMIFSLMAIHFMYNAVTCFCLTILLLKMSSYITGPCAASCVSISTCITGQVRIFCMVSGCGHPRGQEMSGYSPLKSFLTFLTVLVLSARSVWTLLGSKSGLLRYWASSSFS